MAPRFLPALRPANHPTPLASVAALAAVLFLAVRGVGAEEASPPAALLLPAGPAYPIEPLPDAGPSDVPPVVEVPAPPVVEVPAPPVVEVPAPQEVAGAPPLAEPSLEPEAVRRMEPEDPPVELTASQREALRFQMQSYLRQVHERVGAVWAAPPSSPGPLPLRPPAASRAPRREALVTVVIARNGRVVDVRVDRSSRDAGFDRSALRALGRPYLFPPLPPYYETDALEVGLRFADPARR